MRIVIKEAKDNSDIKQFIQFQHELYRSDKAYVPELYISQKEMFNTQKYPFYKYGQAKHFMAFDENKMIGRISAISNPRYNQFHNSNVGFFGFFDFIDSFEVAQTLLDAANDWLRKFDYDRIIGPTNFTTNESAGYLVEGFKSSPFIMMTYNFPYYLPIIQKLGFVKEMDLYAYMIYTDKVSEKSIRIASMVEERLATQDITVRKIRMKEFDKDAAKIKSVYNSAWENNWGFVPFTDKEFHHLAGGLKMMLDEDFGYIAEHAGKPVAFSISLPNINEITKSFKNGKLLPFNLLSLLFRKKKTKFVRIVAMGVQEEFRKKGIEAIFFAKNILEAKKRGILGGEASWVLENNAMMKKAAENLNGELYKTYRLYSYNL